jgi:hypothetical protein
MDLVHWHSDASAEDGLCYLCSTCHNEYMAEYIEKNRERIRRQERERRRAAGVAYTRAEVVDGKLQCSVCGQWKPLEEMCKTNKNSIGRKKCCKACHNERVRATARIET